MKDQLTSPNGLPKIAMHSDDELRPQLQQLSEAVEGQSKELEMLGL